MLMASYVTCQRMLLGITIQTIDCSALRRYFNCYLAYSMNMVIRLKLSSFAPKFVKIQLPCHHEMISWYL